MSTNANEVKSSVKNGSTKSRRRTPKAAAATSKVDQARAIFNKMEGKPRRDVVADFVSTAGLTPSGASTYYQKFLNELKATGKAPSGSRTRGRPLDEGSKAGMARAMFKKMHGKPRKEIVAQFVDKLHLTESGAATYYQSLKKAAA